MSDAFFPPLDCGSHELTSKGREGNAANLRPSRRGSKGKGVTGRDLAHQPSTSKG